MSAPIIGITATRALNAYGFPINQVAEAYTQALARAGAAPLIIPLGLPAETLRSLLSRLDGVLFSGGGDMAPEQYGHEQHPLVEGVDPDRDRVEIQLLQDAMQAELPFLGICRGMQVINVGLGGTLYEDILDQRPGALKHQYFPERPRSYLAHPVQLAPGSRLGQILKENAAQVNSLHHQGLEQVAAGVRVSATAPDGLVEAFELPDYRFGMAVQWHPEWLQDDPAMRHLFQAFVEAAAEMPRPSRE